ncbi:MAG: protease modulator HflC [Acidobacteria bacterium]|nr:protease modulator HflC [Acidobacteriota bacterium]
MKAKTILIAILAFAMLLILSSFAFIVNETEQVVITQFGDPVGDPITEPGIHFKLPLIQKANFFDKRFLEWDGAPEEVTTKDKRFIWVDTYARWRIKDPLLFFQRLRDETRAQTRLDDILDGETRNAIANHDLVELIRSSNREIDRANVVTDNINEQEDSGVLDIIEVGRDNLTHQIIAASSPVLEELGIELLDLRFKRINYVEEVQRRIYERMITERKRIAERYRSEGRGEASRILGEKERELRRIRSEAYKTAQEIIGKADAEATTIYAKAYDQNQQSRDFYRFLKTMETYKTSLTADDWLVLSTEGDFFSYLKRENGR